MAGDTSLWQSIVVGAFTIGGVIATAAGTAIRDGAQQRREAKKRRADKFEELVAAVYEFDHWIDDARRRDLHDDEGIPQTVSPFAKVQSISAIYFPQFGKLVLELDATSSQYVGWMYKAKEQKVIDGFKEAYKPYMEKRQALLRTLQDFASEEFQQSDIPSATKSLLRPLRLKR
jgi:hypothetical protein